MNNPILPTTFANVDEVRKANKAINHHWFDRESMAFFNSQVIGADKLINKRFFVTGEQFDEKSPRLWSIRYAKPDGAVETYGEFQAYETRRDALSAAHSIVV